MNSPTITYADVVTKQVVEDWADDKGFNAADQLCLHLEERFHVNTIEVVAVIDQSDFLILQVTTDQWQDAREFGLLSNGSLAW